MELSQTTPVTPLDVPFDFAATTADARWRDVVAWPLAYAEAFRVSHAITRAAIACVDRLEDDAMRRAALLGLGSVFAVARSLGETAVLVQAEASAGLRLVGGSAELAVLRGETAVGHGPDMADRALFKPMAAPRGAWLRRLARTASWTSWPRRPATFLAPQITAITHNDVLRDAAARASARVGFHHAEALLRAARRRGARAPAAVTDQLEGFAVALATALAAIDGLAGPYRGRLAALIEPTVAPAVARAAADLEGLRRQRRLPRRLWSGSGGYYPARAVGIEARRRGGHVTRFTHGWFAGLCGVPEPFWFAELAVSDRYVVETPAAAENLRAIGAAALMPNCGTVEIVGHEGASPLSGLPLERPARRRAARPRVLYAPTILRGARQFLPPLLPDVIYLDWQFRLVDLLARLPVELLCKPHPEGLLRGQVHPLAARTATSARPFEAHIAEADRFLFDYGQSTTFAEALCTDRPIVFIDMGNPIFSPQARAMIERRCTVIPARFDTRNRPFVESAELEHALCGGAERADPSECRALLMGTAA